MIARRQLLAALPLLAGAWQAPPAAAQGAASAPAPAGPSWYERLARITGIGLAPGQLRGASQEAAGSVWVADLEGREPPVRWSQASVYRWPVFSADGRSVYALLDEQLVRLDGPGREPVLLQRLAGVHKLVGVAEGELLLLRHDPRQPLAALSLVAAGAAPRLLALDAEPTVVQRLLGRIRGEVRGTEDFIIGPLRQQREGLAGPIEWHDIVLQPREGGAARNLSRSDGIDCTQPALDARAEQVAYILADG